METSWLHRYSVLLATCTAFLFFTGPAVSSNEARPLYSLGQTHIWLGTAVGIFTAGLAIWLWRLKKRSWLQRLAWVALGANIAEGLLGLVAEPLPASVRISHSLLGQLFFSTTVAIVVFTSRDSDRSPGSMENGALLQFVAMATPALVLSQVALGVLFRHGIVGMLPHILWAFVIALSFVLVIATTRNAGHAEVRRAGIAFTVVASVQILFGFALFLMQAVDAAPIVLIVTTAIHATTGAITLAAAIVLAILIRRPQIGSDHERRIVPL
jgi:heme A synthase